MSEIDKDQLTDQGSAETGPLPPSAPPSKRFYNTRGGKIGMWVGGAVGLALFAVLLLIYRLSMGAILLVGWIFLWMFIGSVIGFHAETIFRRLRK